MRGGEGGVRGCVRGGCEIGGVRACLSEDVLKGVSRDRLYGQVDHLASFDSS